MASDQELILVYAPERSQRLRYVLDIFFNRIVRGNYQLSTTLADFQAFAGPKIQYNASFSSAAQGLFIPASGLLQDNTAFDRFVVSQLFVQARTCLDQKPTGQREYDFDLLALCFYLLSQYELYQHTYPTDHLGRLSGRNSQLFQAGLLDRPLVDELCLRVVHTLRRHWPDLQVSFPEYQYTPTYDIDISRAFGHRSLPRHLGAIGQDLAKADLPKLRQRWRVWRGWEKDPFDTFDFLDQLHEQYALKPIYFFLLGDYGGLDRNIHPQHPAQRQLFGRLAQKYRCGLHPSVRSHRSAQQLTKECDRFAEITGRPARHSRQHYLVLDLPDTYRQLRQQGIQHEYSIGYADLPGFRAGIARPFPWYDLEREEITDLLLHPFILMDQALRRITDKDHLSLSEKTLSFAQVTKAVNGHFYSVWHNSSFAALEGWQDWPAHYETMIKQLT